MGFQNAIICFICSIPFADKRWILSFVELFVCTIFTFVWNTVYHFCLSLLIQLKYRLFILKYYKIIFHPMIRICNIPKIFMHKYHNSPINYVVYIYINPDKTGSIYLFNGLKYLLFTGIFHFYNSKFHTNPVLQT